MFYPRRDFRRDPPDEGDVLFPVAKDIRLSGRIHVAGKDSPVILLFHGNGEIASDYDGIAPIYNKVGVSLLVADYRGYGKSDGAPTASALLDDAIATYRSAPDILSQHGIGRSTLFIMGRSLGSAAAIEIASQVGDEISGLIIESGFAHPLSLIERLGGKPPARSSQNAGGFDNLRKIERIRVPTLIIHGEEDFIIPLTDGEDLFHHCGAEKKQFVSIPGAGHNDLFLRGRGLYFYALREFVLGRSAGE